MNLRPLFRYPATTVLGLSWCIVFGVMAFRLGEAALAPGRAIWGVYIPTGLSHLHGDVTPRELYAGEFWRAITATFVHFNLLHLILNLVGLIQLGRMIESWYGSSIFLLIYAIIAALGNLSANLARPFLGDPFEGFLMHSGGGSTVVLGLVGLITVVGWRNPSEFPKRARWWLVGLLVFNGLLGVFIPRIDNLGHLAGTLVGAGLGLLDPYWLKLHDRKTTLGLGILAGAVLAGSLLFMVQDQRRELGAWMAMAQSDRRRVVLENLKIRYELVALHGWRHREALAPRSQSGLVPPPLLMPYQPQRDQQLKGQLRDELRTFKAIFPGAQTEREADANQCIRVLAARALSKAPTGRELLHFERCLNELRELTTKRLERRIAAYEALNRPEPRFATQWLTQRMKSAAQAGGPPPGTTRARTKPAS